MLDGQYAISSVEVLAISIKETLGFEKSPSNIKNLIPKQR